MSERTWGFTRGSRMTKYRRSYRGDRLRLQSCTILQLLNAKAVQLSQGEGRDGKLAMKGSKRNSILGESSGGGETARARLNVSTWIYWI